MENISANFLKKLSLILKESGIKDTVFTTGICAHVDKCYYECYFYESTLNMNVKELYDLIMDIQDVEELTIERVTEEHIISNA